MKPASHSMSVVLTGEGSAPLADVWGRRLISLTAVCLATLVVWGAFLPLLVISLVADALRRKRLATTRTLLFFALYLGLQVAGVTAATWVWLRHRRPDRLAGATLALQRWWTTTLRRGAFRIFSLRSRVVGAEHCSRGPIIGLFRHCSVADTMLPMMLIGTPHLALRWVLKAELLWDPCMDIVGRRLRNCFVWRMPETSQRDVDAVGSLMRDLTPNEGVVIYPEGTRFTAKKRLRIIDKLREDNPEAAERARSFRHVLPPRLGGTLALLSRNTAKADVLFCAHRGLESIATFADLWNGKVIGNTVDIEVWRVPFEEVPTERDERIRWLLEQWRRVDAFVGQSTSISASSSNSPPPMGDTSEPRP